MADFFVWLRRYSLRRVWDRVSTGAFPQRPSSQTLRAGSAAYCGVAITEKRARTGPLALAHYGLGSASRWLRDVLIAMG